MNASSIFGRITGKYFLTWMVIFGTFQSFLVAQNFIQEKIHLHADRELYMPGETMGLKVYATDAQLNLPSTLSRVAYIELWDVKGNLILQTKSQLNKGLGTAFVQIPPKAATGLYQLRAYTKWMANGSSADFFHGRMVIFNPDEPVPLRSSFLSDKKLQSELSLFPEGGKWVEGINSRTGIKITDKWGNPKKAVGRIENTEGATVDTFQTNEPGLGMFEFTPEPEQNYVIRLLEPADTNQVFTLPKAAKKGLVMRVENGGSYISVEMEGKHLADPDVFVRISKRGYSYERLKFELEQGKRDILIPMESIPVGELTIFIENEQGDPLAFRKIYIEQNDPLQIELALSKELAGQREQVILDIQTRDHHGEPISANLSLSIAKKSHLPLFFGSNQKTKEQIDLEMLTQSLGKPVTPKQMILPDLYGINLGGYTTNQKGEKVGGAKVVFSLPGKIPFVRITNSNEEGRFNFLLEDLYGNREIVLGAHDSTGVPLNIELDDDILGDIPYPSPFSFTSNDIQTLRGYFIQHQIQEAFASALPVSPRQIIPEIKPFYQVPSKVYPLDNYSRFDTEETFNEIIYTVGLRKKQEQWSLQVFNDHAEKLMKENPLIMVDGVPIRDANALIEINSKEIEKVEIVTSVFYLNQEKLSGIVHAVTYKGNAQNIALPKSYIRRPYAFFAPAKMANSAIPDSRQEQDHRIPDLRNLLHWEPNIQTDEAGKARLVFYTSDVLGEFDIRLEGLSDEGKWGEKRSELMVKVLPK